MTEKQNIFLCCKHGRNIDIRYFRRLSELGEKMEADTYEMLNESGQVWMLQFFPLLLTFSQSVKFSIAIWRFIVSLNSEIVREGDTLSEKGGRVSSKSQRIYFEEVTEMKYYARSIYLALGINLNM